MLYDNNTNLFKQGYEKHQSEVAYFYSQRLPAIWALPTGQSIRRAGVSSSRWRRLSFQTREVPTPDRNQA